jgi:TonB family protein
MKASQVFALIVTSAALCASVSAFAGVGDAAAAMIPAAGPASLVVHDDAAAVRGVLLRSAHYPTSREARQLRPSGTVEVWMEIGRDGQLLGSGIDKRSGSPQLDDEALRAVRRGRYPALSSQTLQGQASQRFIAPITFTPDGQG